MQRYLKFFLFVIMACFLNGCSRNIDRSHGITKAVSKSTAEVCDESVKVQPMIWEQNLEFGKLIYQIDSVHIFTDVSEIGDGGFGEHSEIVFYDGTFYEKAMNNWQQYGSQYEHIYNYPDYIDENGKFVDGAYMIAVDITVKNENATNQLTNSQTGKVETRYGNPYLFKVDSILYLLDRGDNRDIDGNYYGKCVGFFSGYGNYTEHPFAYELKLGEKTSFRIGFLIGNRVNGSRRFFPDLVVCTNSNTLEDAVWFNLNLEDVS